MNRVFNLRVLLVVAITGLVLVATMSVSLLHMTAFDSYARSEAIRTLDGAALAIQSRVERLLKPASDIVQYVEAQNSPIPASANKSGRQSQFSAFLQPIDIILRSNPHISGAYLGYSDGSFVIQTRTSKRVLKAANLPPSIKSDYLRFERDSTAERPTDVWSHFLSNTWHRVERPVSKYNPRERPWYRLGRRKQKPSWTRLYRFSVDDGYGMTLVAGVGDKEKKSAMVVGVDVRLEDLTSFIRKLKIGSHGFAFIARPNGELVTHPNLDAFKLSSDIDTRAPTLFEIHRTDKHDLRLFEALSSSKANTIQFEANDRSILGQRLSLTNLSGFDGHLYVAAPLSDFTVAADQLANKTILIAGGLILMVMAIGAAIARAIAKPVHDAARAMTAVSQLDLQQAPTARRSPLAEIEMLNSSVETMQSALHSFVRYVPRDVVRDLLELRQPLELGGRRREVTILFTDIENFTALAETDQHQRFIDGLADYFDIISGVIAAHGGTVDKYIGDSVMAIWGAPRDDAEHTKHACDAVVQINRQLDQFNQERERLGEPRLLTRFGIHRGYTFVGNVGARDRFGYTALGDVVNVAARLESVNKDLGTRVLVSRDVIKTAGSGHQFAARGEVTLRGKSDPMELFELVLEDEGATVVDLPVSRKSNR